MCRFAGIEPGDDRIPDETTILHFRHLLVHHDLTEALFEEVNAHPADKGIGLRAGTPVDATIIPAPSSTKNRAEARDPDMSSTKKGNARHFGMKAHVGLEATTAKSHDSRVRADKAAGGKLSTSAFSQFDSEGTYEAHGNSEREAAFTRGGGFWGVMRNAPEGGGPTGSSRWSVPRSSIRSGWSSGSSAMRRRAIAGWPGTGRTCSRSSPSATCFSSDDSCLHVGEIVQRPLMSVVQSAKINVLIRQF